MFALSSLGAGAAAGCRRCVRLGGWHWCRCRVPLQGAAPGCRSRVLPRDVHGRVHFRGAEIFCYLGPMLAYFGCLG